MTGLLAATTGASAAAPAPLRIVLVGPDQAVAGLAERVADLFADTSPPPEIARVAAVDPSELFRLDGPGVGAPTAWVSVGGGRARVRVAAPARDLFVFRDLAVGEPLSELDRERVGQMLKAALGALAEGGAGLIGRTDAEAALGIRPAPPAAPSPAAVAPPATRTAAQPPPAPAGVRFHLGGFYALDFDGKETMQSPGLVAALTWDDLWWRPRVWTSISYVLPHDIEGPSGQALTFTLYGQTARAGFDVEWAPRLWFGLGGGVNHIQTIEASDNVPQPYPRTRRWVFLARLMARFGPVPVAGLQVAASAWVDYAVHTELFEVLPDSPYNPDRARPGLALELWWR